jgi:hypothetical protein
MSLPWPAECAVEHPLDGTWSRADAEREAGGSLPPLVACVVECVGIDHYLVIAGIRRPDFVTWPMPRRLSSVAIRVHGILTAVVNPLAVW